MLSHRFGPLNCPITHRLPSSRILPRTVGFRLPLALAQIGPEACACNAPAAVSLIAFSLRGNDMQQFAHHASSPPQPSAMPRDRLTQAFPHPLSRVHVHHATGRRREKRRTSLPSSWWSVGVLPWHAVSFRSPRRAHVGRADGYRMDRAAGLQTDSVECYRIGDEGARRANAVPRRARGHRSVAAGAA